MYYAGLRDFASIDVDVTMIAVSWIAHDNSDCIPLFTYYVTIFEDGGVLLESDRTKNNYYTFYNLTGNTNYTIVVLAAIGNTNGTNVTVMLTTDSPGLLIVTCGVDIITQ